MCNSPYRGLKKCACGYWARTWEDEWDSYNDCCYKCSEDLEPPIQMYGNPTYDAIASDRRKYGN